MPVPYLNKDRGDEVPYVYLTPQEPSQLPPGTVGVEILKYSPDGEMLVNRLPEQYRVENLKSKRATTTILIGTSNNLWGQLQQLGKSTKGGPYYMDGRDGQLTIHNQKKSSPIFAVYTYAGGNGELLEFHVQSSYVKSAVEVSRNTEIDGDTKNMNTTVVQGMVEPDQGNVDAYYQWSSPKTSRPNRFSAAFANATEPGHFAQDLLDSRRYNHPSDPYRAIDTSQDIFDPVMKGAAVFNGKNEAISYLKSNPRLTKEERDTWLNTMAQKHKAYTGQVHTIGTLEYALKEGFEWEPCVIKRKAFVRHLVNPTIYGSDKSIVNPLIYGSDNFRPSSPNYQVTHNRAKVSGDLSRWKKGYKYLKENPNFLITSRKVSVGGFVEVIEYMELEIPLEGVRVLADTPNFDIPEFFSNDISENLTNQVKANARVLGRPGIESSMNIEIRNVSSKYSGIWYSKKAIHRINIGTGYTVDIEFTQRDTPISTVTITKEMATQKATVDINKAAKEALRTGSYKWSSDFKGSIKDWVKSKWPGKSHLIVVNPDDPSQYSVYVSDKDFATEYQEGKPLDMKTIKENNLTHVGTFKINP